MVTIAGSTKLWAFEMAEQMEKHGLLDELMTSYSYSKNTFARRFIKRIDREDIPLEKIKTNLLLAFPIGTFRKKSYLWNILFDHWVAWNLRRSKSKVFIGWSGMSLYSIRAAKKKGMITIVERGSSHILTQNEILKEEYKRYHRDFSINRSLIRRELKEYAEADYIAVPSFFVRNSFIGHGTAREKLFLNSYGATAHFKPQPGIKKAGDPFRIVYLGAISIRKGLVYLFEALHQLSIPDESCEVLLIGNLSREMEKTLATWKRGNWKVIGHVDHYRLPDLLATCDVGIQPSLEEGLSMVIPQMMACGLPVIVTPNTGGENIIEDGENGFIVPIRNAAAIAEKIEWLYRNPEEREEMRLRAAASIQGQFTWDAYGKRYKEFIEGLPGDGTPFRKKLDEEKSMVSAIYTHPEYYPPLLNALDELSQTTDRLFVVCRNLKLNHWQYPDNVELLSSGDFVDIRVAEQTSIAWKFRSFVRFTRDFYTVLTRRKHEWVICQDPISLLSYRLLRPLIGYKPRLWYHNHDVVELSALRKYSIGYFSVLSEKQFFRHIDLFSLPSIERLNSFPYRQLKGPYFILPNYPSTRRAGPEQPVKPDPAKLLKLIYQGHLGNDHGLDQFVDFVEAETNITLTLIGPGNASFIRHLRNLIDKRHLKDRVFLRRPVPYALLKAITASHHIGLAVHEPVNIAFRTAAMASNKIYEYAASGLPVLFFDDEHYKKYLSVYPWALPTDLSLENIRKQVGVIQADYENLSKKAVDDFNEKLNFGVIYKPVIEYMTTLDVDKA
jgi:glycosyltransferase involved in cell wall biosynthesis